MILGEEHWWVKLFKLRVFQSFPVPADIYLPGFVSEIIELKLTHIPFQFPNGVIAS